MSDKPETEQDGALPELMPLFPLSGALLLPGGQMPLNIFEPRYLRMVDDALATTRTIGMIQPRDENESGRCALYHIGCAGRLTGFNETEDGRYLINLTGMRRFRIIEEINPDTPYRQAAVDYSTFENDAGADPSADGVDRSKLEASMRHYLTTEGLKTDWDAVSDAPTQALIVSLAMGCPFNPNEKQALLEAPDTATRAECLVALMEMACSDSGDDSQLQ